jgi:hypothetical protein
MRKESTRIREQGTHVTVPEQLPDPPAARIAALRQIVVDRQYAKIDGITVDLFSASTILAVYDALNDTNKAKFSKLEAHRMFGIAFKTIQKRG